MTARAPASRISLRGRALALLARREHSRVELARKLAPHAESAAQLEETLDALEREKLLSAARFVQSVVHRRAARFGVRRIAHELQQHQLQGEVSAPALADLKATERERAQAVWQRRFGEVAESPAERGRQHRFLAQRGFSAEAIRWVLRQGSVASALDEEVIDADLDAVDDPF